MADGSGDDAWKSIEVIQWRIRGRVFQEGMAGRLHIMRGADMLKSPAKISNDVMPFDNEHEEAEYLRMLPGLIDRTAAQDANCARVWDSRESSGLKDYPREQATLAALFLTFKFKLISYERIVKQLDKPHLRRATELLALNATGKPVARELESTLRLTLQEFVDLEMAIADDLRELGKARARIVSAHVGLASEMAKSISGPEDQESVHFALCGLTKATEHYLYWRGYGFHDYAVEWIETAIRERKTWGLNRISID